MENYRKTIRRLGKALVPVAAALVGALVTYALTRPAPLANMDCAPVSGPPPLTVRCTNLSQYFDGAIWFFDDSGKGKKDSSDGTVEHTYTSPGDYTVLLRVTGTQQDEHTRAIQVTDVPPRISPNIRLRIVAVMRDETIVENTNINIGTKKSDHPRSSSHSRKYGHTFSAKEGYRISDYRFRERDSNNAEYIVATITNGGASIDFSYQLTSGPWYDRWDGWLYGTLTLEQTRIDRGERLTISSDFNVDTPGLFELPKSVDLQNLDRWELYPLGDEAEALVLSLSEVLHLTEPDVDISIESRSAKLYVRVSAEQSDLTI